MLITILIVIFTFMAPFWLKIIFIGANMYIPDAVPFLDEFLQLTSIFSKNPVVKTVQTGNAIRKVANKLSD